MRSQYREMAVAWDEATDNPTGANRIFGALHVLYKSMRQLPRAGARSEA
jgi:hypothetical protein